MYEWKHKYMDGWIDGDTNKWMDGQMETQINGWIDGDTNTWMDGQMETPIHGWMIIE